MSGGASSAATLVALGHVAQIRPDNLKVKSQTEADVMYTVTNDGYCRVRCGMTVAIRTLPIDYMI